MPGVRPPVRRSPCAGCSARHCPAVAVLRQQLFRSVPTYAGSSPGWHPGPSLGRGVCLTLCARAELLVSAHCQRSPVFVYPINILYKNRIGAVAERRKNYIFFQYILKLNSKNHIQFLFLLLLEGCLNRNIKHYADCAQQIDRTLSIVC